MRPTRVGFTVRSPVAYINQLAAAATNSKKNLPCRRLFQQAGLAPGRSSPSDEIVNEICHKLTTGRFVTIVGPGGLGKTTVALSVAHTSLPEFFGAVCFVELSPLTDPRRNPA
jgi:ABC-type dipeptide/oligopeptide/nickel transport system ATPase subunit